MAETEVKEVELGTLGSMADYNAARDKGETSVKVPAEKAEEKAEEKQAEGGEEKQEAKDKPKVSGGFQRKIDRLTKAAAEAQERADKAEALARELQAKTDKVEEKAPVKTDARPVEEDFKTIGEYIEALTDWKLQQTLKAKAEEEERESEEVTVQEIFTAYKENIVATKAKYEDFQEVVDAAMTPWSERGLTKIEAAAADAFRTAVMEDDNAGEIQYYLAKHPDEFAKLGEYTPAQVVKAVARLSDKLTAENPADDEDETQDEVKGEEKPAKIVSKSAPPIKPVNSGATKSTIPLGQVQSMAEYNKLRDAGRVR